MDGQSKTENAIEIKLLVGGAYAVLVSPVVSELALISCIKLKL